MAITVTIASGATWQEVAADRQSHRDATIAAVQPPIPKIEVVPQNTTSLAKKFLTAEEVRITETLVEDLAPRLVKGDLSSTVVIKAFLRRAALAQIAVSGIISNLFCFLNCDTKETHCKSRPIVSRNYSVRKHYLGPHSWMNTSRRMAKP